MTLNASGPISMAGTTTGQSIEIELGESGTVQGSLNDSNFRTLAAIPSGQISLSDFYGKSNVVTINLTISANTANYNIRTAAGSPSGVANVTVTINSGIVVYGYEGAIPPPAAIDTGTGWTAGSTIAIINNGNIFGGSGITQPQNNGNSAPGTAGNQGGDALKAQYAVTVTNSGIIAGGGAGGGSGGAFNSVAFGGFGGEGSGGIFGLSGSNPSTSIAGQQGGGPGGTGGSTPTTGLNFGTNGTGGNSISTSTGTAGAGGGGGAALGGDGGAGGTASSTSPVVTVLGGAGGTGGSYVSGSSNVTWASTGTRIGRIDAGNICGFGGSFVLSSASPTATSGTINFNSNGTISNSATAASQTIRGANTAYYRPTTVSIGTSYWIRATTTSGSAPTTGTMGSWTQLSSNRSWVYGPLGAPSNITGTVLFEISTSNTGIPVVTSGSYSFNVTRT
jgi:hypothetical protein